MIKLQMAKWLSLAIFEMKNPRLSGKMISVTKVELSSDKRYANVYISVLGSDEKKSGVFEILEHAAGSLELKFRKNLRLRSAPVIRLKEDKGIESSSRRHKILEGIHERHPSDR